MLLAAFIDDSRLRDHIARQLTAHAQLQFCDTRPDVLGVLDRLDVAALICQLHDRRGQPVAPLIRTVRQRHSMLPVIAIVRTDDSRDVREIVPAVRAGLNDILVDREGAWEVVRNIVRRGRLDCTTLTLIRGASPYIPHGARSLVEQYFWSVGPRSNVQQVAAALGISRRTLAREHVKYGLPQPYKLMTWSRVLAAGCLLGTVRTGPMEQIARLVGFSSSGALRRATRDYANVLPSELRNSQSFDVLFKRFAGAIRRSGARTVQQLRMNPPTPRKRVTAA